MQCQLSGAPPQDKRRLPCQVCSAVTKTEMGHWEFEVVEWHDGYEAAVSLNGKRLAHERDLPSRLDAQKRAEVLAREFCEDCLSQLFSYHVLHPIG